MVVRQHKVVSRMAYPREEGAAATRMRTCHIGQPALAITCGLLTLSVLLVSCGASQGNASVKQGATPSLVATATLSPTATVTAPATSTPRPTPTNTPRPRPTSTKMPQPTATPAPTVVRVSIVTSSPNPYTFSPGSITVPKGTKIIWTNMTSAPHTVTSDAGAPAAFDSGTLLYASNSTFSFVFTTPGTYSYHCSVHPYMTATIMVTG